MFGTVAANQVLCLDVHHNCRALSTFDKLPMDVPMKATPPIYNPTAHSKLCSKKTHIASKKIQIMGVWRANMMEVGVLQYIGFSMSSHPRSF